MPTTGVRDDSTVLGTMLLLVSAVAFGFSGVLTKSIEADAWTVACWRGLVGGVLIAGYVALSRRDRSLPATFRLGRHGWATATVGSLASLAFIFSFKLTYVANVTVIYATVPFMAAGLGWWLMRERVGRRTLAAAGLSLVGVVIVVVGGLGQGSILGDAVALGMTFAAAVYTVLIRHHRDGPVVLAGAVSALQLFVVAWLFVDPLDVSAADAVLLVVFGTSFALSVVLWTEGTRRLPAAESGLLGVLEVPVAILFAWWILAELPPASSLLGGGIVLVAVLGHAAHGLARRRATV